MLFLELHGEELFPSLKTGSGVQDRICIITGSVNDHIYIYYIYIYKAVMYDY